MAERPLVAVLDGCAPPNGIYAVFLQRNPALRVRLWIDFVKHHYGPGYWRG